MPLLETYLRDLSLIRATGAAVAETSYYPALSTLFNSAGRGLRPQVRCVVNPANRGAGIPDVGLFTADQLQKAGDEPLPGQLPARGVVEVKGTAADAWAVAASAQVRKYWQKYRQVLVTNYRDFVLVGEDADGQQTVLETYSLAASEGEFWQAAALAPATAAAQGERFAEFVKRVMLHAAPLTTPQDVAWLLASYARDARTRIEGVELPALAAVRAALEEALGLTFQGERGEHFFRSTLVQTLFYGVFSAWVLWSRENLPGGTARFNWHETVWLLHVPVISTLFEQVATPSKLQPLGLVEVLDWTGAALNRVDRAAFFARFAEGHAVQYFYEPFLEAFDPELRKDLGVWYTPDEIVRYQVARVDTVLREELGRPDGLADPAVYVLDPCCGTGTYLLEVLRRIDATLRARGEDALVAGDLKRAALGRVFGFELLPAPFVVAHLQLGLLLHNLGAPLAGAHERAGVYLTNALTGWEEPAGPQRHLPFPGLEEERDAAGEVKRERPILVILGNPPYNSFAGLAVGEERALSTAYRVATATKQPQGQGLNDLYVRFFRMAERRIVERTGAGIICYISNYSWLDGLSFTAMRERYLEVFDRIWIDNLHGDRIISEYAPDGRTSETVFATSSDTPGIKVGTAIAVLVRSNGSGPDHRLYYRDHTAARAAERRTELLESVSVDDFSSLYNHLTPNVDLGLPFKPLALLPEYIDWPLLPDLFPTFFPGVTTSCDDVVVDIDRERLVRRMEQYFDPAIGHEQMRRIAPNVMKSNSGFNAEAVRDYLRKRGFLSDRVIRYYYRPFDVRWLYWEPETKLLDRKREEYLPHVFEGNVWLSAGQRNRKEDFYQPQFIVRLADYHVVESNAGMFPLYLSPTEARQATLFDSPEETETGPRPNLSERALAYLGEIDAAPEVLFYHCLAVLHAPAYRAENAGALRQDWPRVPLLARREALLASAALGRQVAALLDGERGVPGVTEGVIRPELRAVAAVARLGGGSLNPDTDLALTVGWGHAGQNGVVMPGKGRAVERAYTQEERAAVAAALGLEAKAALGLEAEAVLGLEAEAALALLGAGTLDVYLNDAAYWRNVPERVWAYTIGGYQVMKKWLSYRERTLLGRPLRLEEAREVTAMARRIAAILLLEPALDASYAAVKGETGLATADGTGPATAVAG